MKIASENIKKSRLHYNHFFQVKSLQVIEIFFKNHDNWGIGKPFNTLTKDLLYTLHFLVNGFCYYI